MIPRDYSRATRKAEEDAAGDPMGLTTIVIRGIVCLATLVASITVTSHQRDRQVIRHAQLGITATFQNAGFASSTLEIYLAPATADIVDRLVFFG